MADARELHEAQADYWNGPGGARWIENQHRRDLMLADFASVAVERAAPRPGERVVDVGCGCGETTVELARAVGPSGRVVGVDVSAPIVSVAREAVKGLPQAEILLADAATRPFEPAAADLLFSRFGVMFFGDPLAAFRNLRRAMKPDGRLVFVCWRSPAENPWMTASLEAVWRHVDKPPPADPNEPGPFAFADRERVAAILTGAGFADPDFERYDPMIDVSAGEGVEGAVATALEFGPTARALAGQPDPVLAAVGASLRDFYAPKLEGGAIRLPAAVWLVSAGAA